MFELNIETILLACLIMIIAELVGAIMNGGGGFISQPLLLAIGIPPHVVIAHDVAGSLGTNMAIFHYSKRKKMVNKSYILWFLPGVIVGSLIGVNVLVSLDGKVIEKIIGILALIWGGVILFIHPEKGVVSKTPIRNWKIVALLSSVLFGAYMGVSGAGAGILLAIIFIQFFGFTFLEKRGVTSVICAAAMIVSLSGYIYHELIYFSLLIPMLCSTYIAGYIGSHISFKIGNQKLKIIFSFYLVLISLWLLLK